MRRYDEPVVRPDRRGGRTSRRARRSVALLLCLIPVLAIGAGHPAGTRAAPAADDDELLGAATITWQIDETWIDPDGPEWQGD